MHRVRVCTAAVLLILTAQLPLDAQTWKRIDDSSVCSRCRVQIEKLVQLGSETGGGFVGMPASVVPWKGGWAVTHFAKQHSISLFDASGTFIRDVGRNGEAEGEYRYAGRMAVASDTLYVFDHDLVRLTLYDSAMQVRRVVRLWSADVSGIFPQPGGNLILHSNVRTGDAAGVPLHVVTPEGGIRHSFGVDTPGRGRGRDQMHRHMRVTSGPVGERILTGRSTDYVLELWTLSGEKVSEWRREADWFVPHGRAGMRNRTEPPNPTLNAIWVDDDDLAWVVISIPDPQWADAVIHDAGTFQGIPRNRYTNQNEYFDTLIEVIDLNTGTLITRARMDNRAIAASGGGRIVTYREADDGTQLIEVWRPRLVRR